MRSLVNDWDKYATRLRDMERFYWQVGGVCLAIDPVYRSDGTRHGHRTPSVSTLRHIRWDR